jgi:hypothetical protein
MDILIQRPVRCHVGDCVAIRDLQWLIRTEDWGPETARPSSAFGLPASSVRSLLAGPASALDRRFQKMVRRTLTTYGLRAGPLRTLRKISFEIRAWHAVVLLFNIHEITEAERLDSKSASQRVLREVGLFTIHHSHY